MIMPVLETSHCVPAPQEGKRIRGEHGWQKGLWKVENFSMRKPCGVVSRTETDTWRGC